MMQSEALRIDRGGLLYLATALLFVVSGTGKLSAFGPKIVGDNWFWPFFLTLTGASELVLTVYFLSNRKWRSQIAILVFSSFFAFSMLRLVVWNKKTCECFGDFPTSIYLSLAISVVFVSLHCAFWWRSQSTKDLALSPGEANYSRLCLLLGLGFVASPFIQATVKSHKPSIEIINLSNAVLPFDFNYGVEHDVTFELKNHSSRLIAVNGCVANDCFAACEMIDSSFVIPANNSCLATIRITRDANPLPWTGEFEKLGQPSFIDSSPIDLSGDFELPIRFLTQPTSNESSVWFRLSAASKRRLGAR